MRETCFQWLQRTISDLRDDTSKPWDYYPCLIWPFSRKGRPHKDGNGYGAVFYNRSLGSAHRAAWETEHGTIPDGMQVLHRCDVRDCFRPIHLFLGTTADNLKDCSAKGRMHPGESNPGAKLTADQVREARVRLAAGESQRSIARSFGIHFNAIWKIANGIKWKSVA